MLKDTEDYGPKFNEGVAKCVNIASTNRPVNSVEVLPSRKLRIPQSPSVNPKFRDDLQTKTTSRECSFQSFQENLLPVVQLASKVVDAKKRYEDFISSNDVYVLTVVALALLRNPVYEFSIHTSRCVTSHSQLLRCCLAMSCIRNISQVKRMAGENLGHDHRKASCSSPSYTNLKTPRIR